MKAVCTRKGCTSSAGSIVTHTMVPQILHSDVLNRLKSQKQHTGPCCFREHWTGTHLTTVCAVYCHSMRSTRPNSAVRKGAQLTSCLSAAMEVLHCLHGLSGMLYALAPL